MKNLYNEDGSLLDDVLFFFSLEFKKLSKKDSKNQLKQFRQKLTDEEIRQFKLLLDRNRTNAWRKENPEKKKQQDNLWRQTEKSKKYQREWSSKNSNARAKYSSNWRNKTQLLQKEYRKKQRSKPSWKIRQAVSQAFVRIKKDKPLNALELLGCTWEEAKNYIESLWQEGMTWENHGRYGWHIDHIRPVSSFKEDELHLINRLENLQPLWWHDNLTKSNKF